MIITFRFHSSTIGYSKHTLDGGKELVIRADAFEVESTARRNNSIVRRIL